MSSAPPDATARAPEPSVPSAPAAPRRLPVASGGAFILGHAPEVQSDPLGLAERVFRERGDCVELRALCGLVRWVQLTHPDAVAHVLGAGEDLYVKPRFFVRAVAPLFGRTLFLAEGERWQRNRRIAAPAFSRERLTRLVPAMVAAIDAELDGWRTGEPIDVNARCNRVALRVASRSFFGVTLDAEADAFADALAESFRFLRYRMDQPMPPPLFLPTARHRRFRRAKATLERIIGAVVARRRADGPVAGTDDLLGMLLGATDAETGAAFDEPDLIAEMTGFLIAGHDTTAAALAWTLELLSRHPDVLGAVQDEVDAALGDRPATAEDLPRLGLARRCFEEAMRLYPPAWGQPRETVVDDVVGGFTIPKGTIVTVSQWVTHRHPEFWDRPEQFDPSRFEPAAVAARHRFAYFPFGAGPRVCIGRQLALMEGPLAIAAIARRFDIRRPDGAPPAVPDPTFTLKPKGALPLILSPRRRA